MALAPHNRLPSPSKQKRVRPLPHSLGFISFSLRSSTLLTFRLHRMASTTIRISRFFHTHLGMAPHALQVVSGLQQWFAPLRHSRNAAVTWLVAANAPGWVGACRAIMVAPHTQGVPFFVLICHAGGCRINAGQNSAYYRPVGEGRRLIFITQRANGHHFRCQLPRLFLVLAIIALEGGGRNALCGRVHGFPGRRRSLPCGIWLLVAEATLRRNGARRLPVAGGTGGQCHTAFCMATHAGANRICPVHGLGQGHHPAFFRAFHGVAGGARLQRFVMTGCARRQRLFMQGMVEQHRLHGSSRLLFTLVALWLGRLGHLHKAHYRLVYQKQWHVGRA